MPSRWTLGLILFFAVFLTVNGGMIWLAVSGADEVSPSYLNATRR